MFVRGKWPSTNQALALKRKEGNPRNAHRAGSRYSYAWWAQEGRQAALAAARSYRVPPLAPGMLACIWVYLVYHGRYDPSGWTLAGKWFEDGLVDAQVIGSDRRDVYQVGGRCFGTDEESTLFLSRCDDGRAWIGTPGAVIEIVEGAP